MLTYVYFLLFSSPLRACSDFTFFISALISRKLAYPGSCTSFPSDQHMASIFQVVTGFANFFGSSDIAKFHIIRLLDFGFSHYRELLVFFCLFH